MHLSRAWLCALHAFLEQNVCIRPWCCKPATFILNQTVHANLLTTVITWTKCPWISCFTHTLKTRRCLEAMAIILTGIGGAATFAYCRIENVRSWKWDSHKKPVCYQLSCIIIYKKKFNPFIHLRSSVLGNHGHRYTHGHHWVLYMFRHSCMGWGGSDPRLKITKTNHNKYANKNTQSKVSGPRLCLNKIDAG